MSANTAGSADGSASEGLEALRFPIGRFELGAEIDPGARQAHFEALAATPEALRSAVEGLSDEQLDTPYREGGWTVRQVVHHVIDSQLNGYIRCRWLLTEDHTTLKPYNEVAWAELPDARSAPIGSSLDLYAALQRRWLDLLEVIAPESELWAKTIHHPEAGDHTLDQLVALYDWHGRHHVAHITELRRRSGW